MERVELLAALVVDMNPDIKGDVEIRNLDDVQKPSPCDHRQSLMWRTDPQMLSLREPADAAGRFDAQRQNSSFAHILRSAVYSLQCRPCAALCCLCSCFPEPPPIHSQIHAQGSQGQHTPVAEEMQKKCNKCNPADTASVLLN